MQLGTVLHTLLWPLLLPSLLFLSLSRPPSPLLPLNCPIYFGGGRAPCFSFWGGPWPRNSVWLAATAWGGTSCRAVPPEGAEGQGERGKGLRRDGTGEGA